MAEQLQYALDYRVVIERAVGYLMGAHGLTATTAFNALRKQARDSRGGWPTWPPRYSAAAPARTPIRSGPAFAGPRPIRGNLRPKRPDPKYVIFL